jgi:hypothetical protein
MDNFENLFAKALSNRTNADLNIGLSGPIDNGAGNFSTLLALRKQQLDFDTAMRASELEQIRVIREANLAERQFGLDVSEEVARRAEVADQLAFNREKLRVENPFAANIIARQDGGNLSLPSAPAANAPAAQPNQPTAAPAQSSNEPEPFETRTNADGSVSLFRTPDLLRQEDPFQAQSQESFNRINEQNAERAARLEELRTQFQEGGGAFNRTFANQLNDARTRMQSFANDVESRIEVVDPSNPISFVTEGIGRVTSTNFGGFQDQSFIKNTLRSGILPNLKEIFGAQLSDGERLAFFQTFAGDDAPVEIQALKLNELYDKFFNQRTANGLVADSINEGEVVQGNDGQFYTLQNGQVVIVPPERVGGPL